MLYWHGEDREVLMLLAKIECAHMFVFCFFAFVLFSEQLWLFKSQVEDSTVRDFFYPLNGTENGSQPSLTTLDRELVSVL